MPLAPGDRLGSYVIVGPLGAGGPPPFAVTSSHANYGPLSLADVSGELQRGLAEARAEADAIAPKPKVRTR
jgi:hypothetical protein